MIAIRTQGLRKLYGQTLALEDVSFSVRTGEIHGFLGPNGAGKTTTLKILAGLLGASGGEVDLFGEGAPRNCAALRKRIGFLSDHHPLYREMKAESYFDFLKNLYSITASAFSKNKEELIEELNLGPLLSRRIGHLSRGQRQKVALAGAMIHDPELVILDEPNTGLDPSASFDVRNFLRGLYGKKTVLLSSHLLEEVSKVCTSISVIDRAKIVLSDSVENVLKQGTDQKTLLLLVSGNREQIDAIISQIDLDFEMQVAPTSDGLLRYELKFAAKLDVRAKVMGHLAQHGVSVLEFREKMQSMEEVFQRVTKTASSLKESNERGRDAHF